MITDDQVRRWLSLLRRPDRLATPDVVALLDANGRLPASASAVDVGNAAAQLITEAIARLAAPADATRDQRLPYLVLKTCFLDGAKLFQAANKLGMSERQLSRERAWAIGLLRAELERPVAAPPQRGFRREPLPLIRGFLERDGVTESLRSALDAHSLVMVTGPAGAGKTSIVAHLVADEPVPVLWYRFRAGVNDRLQPLLFELGDYLLELGSAELSTHIAKTLSAFDIGITTRIALKALAGREQLLVFDDFHVVEADSAICGFIEEAGARVDGLRIVTIGRHRDVSTIHATYWSVPPLERDETAELLELLGVRCSPATIDAIHAWTNGTPHLVNLSASWLKTATQDEIDHGLRSLTSIGAVQAFLLEVVTDLLDPDDKAILSAASVFRDRFSDDALAAVAGRTRGAVLDASLRLVRVHAAVRSQSGDSAFFHGTVRDYIYDRLPDDHRAELHRRAARWYGDQGDLEEVEFHVARAEAGGGRQLAVTS